MGSHKFKPGSAVVVGANNWMMLYEDGCSDAVGHVSHWRVDYSEQGPGSALYFWSDGGPRRIITDNPDLARWIREHLFARGSPYLAEDVLIEAGVFSEKNALPDSYGVEVVQDNGSFTATWDDFLPPTWGYTTLDETDVYSHSAVYVPSMKSTIYCDGVQMRGTAVPEDWFGTPSSSSFLATAEVWVERPVEEQQGS